MFGDIRMLHSAQRSCKSGQKEQRKNSGSMKEWKSIPYVFLPPKVKQGVGADIWGYQPLIPQQ